MLAPLPQFTNRQKLIRALLAPDAQQHFHGLGKWRKDYGPVCIMGMILRCRRQANPAYDEDLYDEVTTAAWIGLKGEHMWQLVHKNDEHVPFSQLAKDLEELPLTLEPTPCSEPAYD